MLTKEQKITIGQKIKKYREARHLSQEKLAELCGVDSKKVVSRWETGRFLPRAENLSRLADALNVSIKELIGSDSNDNR